MSTQSASSHVTPLRPGILRVGPGRYGAQALGPYQNVSAADGCRGLDAQPLTLEEHHQGPRLEKGQTELPKHIGAAQDVFDLVEGKGAV